MFSGYGAGRQPQTPAPAAPAPISPGAITYTTSIDRNGNVIFHPFRATPASLPMPGGTMNGIQWVPMDATRVLPPGAQPADADFAASWTQQPVSKSDRKLLKDWQEDEERQKKKQLAREAKEARRLAKQQRASGGAGIADAELRKARERDAQGTAARERRNSMNQPSPAGAAGPGLSAFPTAANAYPAAGSYTPAGYPANPAPNPYPAAVNPGYPSTPYTAGYPGVAGPGSEQPRERKYSTGAIGLGVGDLSQQFGEMGLEHPERTRSSQFASESERVRRMSNNMGDRGQSVAGGYPTNGGYPVAGAAYPAPSSGYTGAGAVLGAYPGAASAGYPTAGAAGQPGAAAATGYPSTGGGNYLTQSQYPAQPGAGFVPQATTPYAAPHTPSMHPSTPYAGQVYPPGHVMEGRPIPAPASSVPVPGAYPPQTGVPQPGGPQAGFSQAPMPGVAYPNGQTPFPSSVSAPEPAVEQLPAPEGFGRAVNAAQAFTPFERMKIQDMDDLAEQPVRMPAVLQAHDVFVHDWNRLMQDLGLAWTGRLPAPGRSHKKSSLAADVIDLWNSSFFFARGIEVILYKGRERRSGPNAGLVDVPYPEPGDTSSDSSESSSEHSSSDDEYPARQASVYGPAHGYPGFVPDAAEQRRRRDEERREKKRRRRERKARRRARERAKRYSLYISCIPNGGPAGVVSGGMPTTAGTAQPAQMQPQQQQQQQQNPAGYPLGTLPGTIPGGMAAPGTYGYPPATGYATPGAGIPVTGSQGYGPGMTMLGGMAAHSGVPAAATQNYAQGMLPGTMPGGMPGGLTGGISTPYGAVSGGMPVSQSGY